MSDTKDESSAGSRKLTKNEKRRLKEKEAKAKGATESREVPLDTSESAIKVPKRASRFAEPSVQISYISANVDDVLQQAASGANTKVTLDSNVLEEFKTMFNKFARAEDLTAGDSSGMSRKMTAGTGLTDADSAYDMGVDDEDADMDTEEGAVLSRRKRRMLQRPSIALLKQIVSRPEVVEAHDVTAADPKLLLFLKCLRHTVPVPQHWGNKKKYLSGKRGTEKPPFELPAFIAETGIDKIRETLLAQEQAKKSKGKARERTRPSMGKIDIDYQVLHDAFFKFQTKPLLTQHGELYYEGKEAEVGDALKGRKPGGPLSEALLSALGMESNNVPPPWLISQQRYGPPPAYPQLKIPGLSAPIPAGGQFGFHSGGWGKPPVDQYGRPLYGDVFGAGVGIDEGEVIVDRGTLWGEMLPEVEPEHSPEASESDSSDDEKEDNTHEHLLAVSEAARGVTTTGYVADLSASAIQAMAQESLDLRKRSATTTHTDPNLQEPPQLYHILEQKERGAVQAGELFGSERTYVLPSAAASTAAVIAPTPQEDITVKRPTQGQTQEEPKRKKVRAEGTARGLDDFKF